MATFTSFQAFGARLGKLNRELNDAHAVAAVATAGEKCRAIATRVASGDLGGDAKFSGWEPTLDTLYKPLTPGRGLIYPSRTGAGPWTVAERGRNQGNASGFHGPGINRRTGVTAASIRSGKRKVRTTKAKRWTGRTKGKATASHAVKLMTPVVDAAGLGLVVGATRRNFD